MTTADTEQSEAQIKRVDFSREVPAILKQAGDIENPLERLELVRSSIVDKSLSAAARGEIVNSDGDVITADKLLDQLGDYRDLFTKPVSRVDPDIRDLVGSGKESSIVTRAGGMRKAAEMLIDSEQARDFLQAIEDRLRERDDERKKIGRETASISGVVAPGLITEIPEHIRNSGGKETEVSSAVEVKPLSARERLDRLTANLPVEERILLRGYADAVHEKRRAQKEGRGDDSIYWGQRIGQYYKEMAPAARNISDQFASLYNSQEQLQ